MNRTWTPPAALPTSLVRRDVRHEQRFAVVEDLRLDVERAAYPTKPRIVSSAHGPIRHLMLWYAAYAPDDLGYQNVYADVLTQLPASTNVTIVTHPDVEADLVALVQKHRPDGQVRIVLTPPSLRFSVWAEDACVVVRDAVDDRVFITEPIEFTRGGDTIVNELVATADGLAMTQSPLLFQGGNVLVGDSFVLVGRDYLDLSVRMIVEHGSVEGFPYGGTIAEQEAATHELFRSCFDPERELHFLEANPVGRLSDRVATIEDEVWLEERLAGVGERQPIFHIDMFVSLAGRGADGRYRVVVGDPSLADQLLGLDRLEHDLQAEYDAVAAQLSALGFDVRRSPLPLWSVSEREPLTVKVDGDHNRVGAGEDGTFVEVVGRVTWYHPTSNNCLVQIDGEARDVWLPTYGHEATPALAVVDGEHKRIWTELGFIVHQLGDFHAFASRLGSLHCIKKYLER